MQNGKARWGKATPVLPTEPCSTHRRSRRQHNARTSPRFRPPAAGRTSSPGRPAPLPREHRRQPPEPCAHPPRLRRRPRAAEATAEEESVVEQGAGLSMAAGPGLAVARQPASEGPGLPPAGGQSSWGAQAGAAPPQTSQGYGGLAPTPCQPPEALARRRWRAQTPGKAWGGRRPRCLLHFASLATAAGWLFLVEAVFVERMIDQEFSPWVPPLCCRREAILCRGPCIPSRSAQNIAINGEESWPTHGRAPRSSRAHTAPSGPGSQTR